MSAFLASLEFWHWMVLGVGLAIVEVFAPGAVFLWLGISAGIVGMIVWLIPGLDWEYQLLFFAILSIASVVIARRYLRAHPLKSDEPNLNLRGHQYVGRTFTLDEPVINGRGKSRWTTPPGRSAATTVIPAPKSSSTALTAWCCAPRSPIDR